MSVFKTKAFVWLVGLAPILVFTVMAFSSSLGPDPGEALIHYTAHTATVFLLITVALGFLGGFIKGIPLKRCSRLLGLFAFFYVFLHVLGFWWFELGFSVEYFLVELKDRPYVYIGMIAFSILMLMALTSTKGWQRRLKKNWKRLHLMVYPALVLIVLHILWVARSDVLAPLLYGVFVAFLIVWRLFNQQKKQIKKTS